MRGRPEVYRTLWTDGQDCQNQGLTTSHRPKTILFTQSISSLIPKMSVFTLAIACLTKSYLTWFIELTFQIPMQYCSLQHQALLSPTDTSFSSYFSTLPQYQIGHLPAWVTHLLVLSFCLFILETRTLKWFAIPFPSRTTFCQNAPPWPIHLGWPCTAWLRASLSHTRLWSMWSFQLTFCDCGFCSGDYKITVLASSVCPLMDEDKRLMQASWWWETGCGENWVFLWWAGPCSVNL